MEIIVRKTYLDHILSHLNRGMIIVIVGQRRVGKSFMLRQVRQWLSENRQDANVVYINKEFREFRDLNNSTELYDYVVARLPEGGDNYLLIDEVQDIEGYEDALRSLYAEERCQVIATGSNAYIFSSELSTRLAGRYIDGVNGSCERRSQRVSWHPSCPSPRISQDGCIVIRFLRAEAAKSELIFT